MTQSYQAHPLLSCTWPTERFRCPCVGRALVVYFLPIVRSALGHSDLTLRTSFDDSTFVGPVAFVAWSVASPLSVTIGKVWGAKFWYSLPKEMETKSRW